MKCYSCKSLVSGRYDMLPDINSYFQGINRGSLLYPNDVTTNLVLYNYIVINKLVKNPSFLHSIVYVWMFWLMINFSFMLTHVVKVTALKK